KRRRRGGQFGAEPTTPSAPFKVASQHLFDVAASPPFQGGEKSPLPNTGSIPDSMITSAVLRRSLLMTNRSAKIFFIGLAAVAVQAFFFSRVDLPRVEPTQVIPPGLAPIATGSPQLYSMRQLPTLGQGCRW